jgi:hypothetical protein
MTWSIDLTWRQSEPDEVQGTRHDFPFGSRASRGDLPAELTCYEPNATIAKSPGRLARGETAIKTFTEVLHQNN